MKKMFKKKFLIVFLFIGLFVLLNPLLVHAEKEMIKVKCDYLDKTNFVKKYGINSTYDGDTGLIRLYIDTEEWTSNVEAIKQQVRFRITEIVAYDITTRDDKKAGSTGNRIEQYSFKADTPAGVDAIKKLYHVDVSTAILSPTSDIVITAIDTKNPINYQFKLVPYNFKDPDVGDKCPKVEEYEWYASIFLDVYGKAEYIDIIYEEPTIPEISSTTVDCSIPHDPRSFAAKYCALKAKVDDKNSGALHIELTHDINTYPKYAASKNLNDPLVRTCNPFDYVPNEPDKPDSEYYKNVSYLHGHLVNSVTRNYVYHFGCVEAKKESVSCKVECDEYVSVEYGPPVAIKAGMCFTYKVKVTSRVSCNVKQKPEPPKVVKHYCVPTPVCMHSEEDYEARTGADGSGPNEDFDACIDACDGGKYTSSCSVQCYNKVYGSNNSIEQKTFLSEFAVTARKVDFYGNATMDRDPSCDGIGHYECNDKWDNPILWMSDCGSGKRVGLATYYKVSGRMDVYHDFPCVKTTAQGGGIAAVCGCSATCFWSGCSNSYISEEQAQADYKANMDIYNELLDTCNNYAKCSTEVSEYTISADYSYDKVDDNGKKTDTEKVTYYYPYAKNNDSNTKATITNNTDFVQCVPADSQYNIFLKTNGCYNCAKNAGYSSENEEILEFKYEGKLKETNLYVSEWTFPGVWYHLKNTSLFSYTPKEGWLRHDKQFCVPLYAKTVNTKWARSYYSALEEKNYTFSNTDKTSTEKRPEVVDHVSPSTIFTTADVSKLKYNINASTRKFGLFQWDIDIRCFYGLIKPNTPSTGGDDDDDDTSDQDKPYEIRPVEATDLFPDPQGKVKASTDNPDITGRAPGFNWSVYANNQKDPNYTSNPATYRTWVQKLGDNVYSDEYLDYDITLTRDVINKLKKQNKSKTGFNNSALDPTVSSVVNYQSDLFRTSSGSGEPILKPYSKVPSAQALRCNNMKNVYSDECFVEGSD